MGRKTASIAQGFDHRTPHLGQLHGGEQFKTQTQYSQAQFVAHTVWTTLQKPTLLKREQHAKHRGSRQTHSTREFGTAQFPLIAIELHQQLQAARQGGHGVAVVAFAFVFVFDLVVDQTDPALAEAEIKAMCEKLLANTVIENYAVEILG